LMPERWNLDGDFMLHGQTLAHLSQRQVRLVGDPRAKHGFQWRNSRSSMPADLKTRPPALRLQLLADLMHPAPAHLKPLRDVSRAFTSLQRVEHPIPQILGICAHMCPSLGRGSIAHNVVI
jgi:hypothetical protein